MFHRKPSSDPRYELVFSAARLALDRQSGDVDNLRSRATSLVAATTLALSFIGGLGLVGMGTKPLPTWSIWGSIGLVLVIAGCCLLILLPRGWVFDLSAEVLINEYVEGSEPEPLDKMYRSLALSLENHYDDNAKKLRWLFILLRVAVAFLFSEIVLLFIAINAR